MLFSLVSRIPNSARLSLWAVWDQAEYDVLFLYLAPKGGIEVLTKHTRAHMYPCAHVRIHALIIQYRSCHCKMVSRKLSSAMEGK
jgi:hypothetical protein